MNIQATMIYHVELGLTNNDKEGLFTRHHHSTVLYFYFPQKP